MSYVYYDKYGIQHATNNEDSAKTNSKDGKYTQSGVSAAGGYATNKSVAANDYNSFTPSTSTTGTATQSLIPPTPSKTLSDFLPSGLVKPTAPTYSYTPREYEDPTPTVPLASGMVLAPTKSWREKYDTAEKNRQIEAQGLYESELAKYQGDTNAYNNGLTLAQKGYDSYLSSLADQQKTALAQSNLYSDAAGLVPSLYPGDPSAQIRQLGSQWQATTDPTLQKQYNQQALTLAKNAGLVPQDYVGSVSGYAALSNAGTPTAAATERQQLQTQKQSEAALNAAYDRWKTLGYVASEADAAILGVPFGTQTNDASYRDRSLSLSASKGGGGASATDIKLQNQSSQSAAVAQEVYSGKDPKQIEAELLSPGVYSQLANGGVDVNKLIDHAYMVKYGMTKTQYDTKMNGTPTAQYAYGQ